MTLVVDASVVVAALVDDGPGGRWALNELATGTLMAPQLMKFEAANVLRRLAVAGTVSSDMASLAHRDVVALPCDLVAYDDLAERAWALRDNLTAYDASYVALAELLRAPLATLDARLTRAPGVACEFRTP